MVGDIEENVFTIDEKITLSREIKTIKNNKMEVVELKNTVPKKSTFCLSLALYIL